MDQFSERFLMVVSAICDSTKKMMGLSQPRRWGHQGDGHIFGMSINNWVFLMGQFEPQLEDCTIGVSW